MANKLTDTQRQEIYKDLPVNSQGYYAGTTVKPGVPQNSVTTPQQNTPTVSQIYGNENVLSGGNTNYDQALSSYGDYYRQQSEQPIDENAIRNNVLNQFQSQIDATNQIYAQKLKDAQLQGQGRLGNDAAIQARRGLLGSDFGSAQTQNIQTFNTGQEDLVNQEKLAAIGEIMGKVREGAAKEIADKRAARETGLENYINYLNTVQERKSSRAGDAVKALLAQGLEPSALSKQDIDVLKASGLSIDDIKAQYKTAKAEKDKADAEKARKDALEGRFSLNEGEGIYNADGSLIASRAKTYKPESGGSGLDGLFSQLGSRAVSFGSAQANTFASSPIVKKYNELGAAANLINAVDPNSQNPAEHQAVIYNFAKALDPESVVREGEYATVKKYSQSLIKKYGGEIKQAISGKGFLSPGAIQAIQQATNNRVQAYAPQYDNLKNQTVNRINTVIGAPVGEAFLIDYETGVQAPQQPSQGGTVRMQGPDGVFNVPSDKVQLYQQNGYSPI